jgi:hypothetical protein
MVIWEPGETLWCAICQCERGGADPPGPWFRHSPSHRRRVPIYQGRSRLPVGYLVLIRP